MIRESSLALARSLSPGLLSGISFSQWLTLLRQNQVRISPRYWPRAFVITAVSLANSIIARREYQKYGASWEQKEHEPPLFVIGVARSGTTYLHNLMATNPGLAYPDIVATRFPRTFITVGWLVRKLIPVFFGATRVQDNVAFSGDSPGEEEVALGSMCLCSGIFSSVFPRTGRQYERYLLADGFSPQEATEWMASFRAFVKKLTWFEGRPLVFKNPANMGRIPLLLEAFPGARIIFIHRHPYDVVRSMVHSSRTVTRYWQLQNTEQRSATWYAQKCAEVMNAYLESRHQVLAGNLVEVAYQQLEEDPNTTVKTIYRSLGLAGIDGAETALSDYVKTLGSYKKNKHGQLPNSVREQLVRDCPGWFSEWGYQK